MWSNASWVPNPDAQTLFAERCRLQGVIVSAIAYGITVALYFMSFNLLIRRKNHLELKKRLPLLIHTTIVFLLGTVFMIALAALTQMAFIDHHNYPGGANFDVTFVLSNWLCDSIVVWRFKVIFQACLFPIWAVMLFPCLLLAGSVALGILFLHQVATSNPYITKSVNYTMPYLGVSLALNIILTFFIVLRLLTFRYRIVSLLGSGYGTQYTSVSAMIIESAALYSTVSIAFLVLFAIGSGVSQVFLHSMIQIQTIATLLIVFRVAQGKGWTMETATNCMSEP